MCAPDPRTRHARPPRHAGVTLVELVMYIMVVSIGVAGILLAMTMTSQRSADPMVRAQALLLARDLMPVAIAERAKLAGAQLYIGGEMGIVVTLPPPPRLLRVTGREASALAGAWVRLDAQGVTRARRKWISPYVGVAPGTSLPIL